MSFVRWPLIALVALLLYPGPGATQSPRFTIEFEGGPAWQSRNDVEIPNDGSATRFALDELAGTGAIPAGRVYLGWAWRERHGVRLLLAPLTLRAEGVPDTEIRFAGATFEGNHGRSTPRSGSAGKCATGGGCQRGTGPSKVARTSMRSTPSPGSTT